MSDDIKLSKKQRKETTPLQQNMHFTIQHDLHHAIALAARKAECRQAKSELSGLKTMFAFGPLLLQLLD